jgi:hypothetical protein
MRPPPLREARAEKLIGGRAFGLNPSTYSVSPAEPAATSATYMPLLRLGPYTAPEACTGAQTLIVRVATFPPSATSSGGP